MSGELEQALWDVAAANRILAREGIVDALGHVSVRHPDDPARYILSRSRSPGIVSRADLMEFTLDNEPIDQRGRSMYAERPIHGGIYETRPDVMAVVHNHSFSVIPFGLTGVPLRPIIHMAGGIGASVPVWDIRDKFGDTNLLVVTREQGRDLAGALGDGSVALMRGHGCVVAAKTLKYAVLLAIYLEGNARILLDSTRLGGDVVALTPGEVGQTAAMTAMPLVAERTWNYWCARANLEGI
jgi:HCOMODA/2-hydroxy-3-carboxy-muconic semialdehyde decarboxylase